MSASYLPVGWNRAKLVYDAAMLAAVAIYICAGLWLAPLLTPADHAPNGEIRRMHVFGTCAFLMLTFILCIGPLARLDRRWLPLLYNRRHFGVMACAVAAVHISYVLGWYFAYSNIDPYVALFASNTSYGQIAGFPFEIFGVIAFAILAVLAVTSHDFWLKFLTPAMWKSMHMAIYIAYAAIIAHIAFGALMTGRYPVLAIVTAFCISAVAGLHLAAAFASADAPAGPATDWIDVGEAASIPEGRGRIVALPDGSRAAIFRHEGRFHGLSNACAHQAGPLGEGCVIDGVLTCPWHGYQYRLTDGCSPPPYTEKIATFNLEARGSHVFLDARANAPGAPGVSVAVESPAAPAPAGDFFVGYLKTPAPLAAFATKIVIAGFACTFALALALGYELQDRGGGRFAGDTKATGVLANMPYPVLRTPPSQAYPRGHTFLVAGGGKNGAAALVDKMRGTVVDVRGFALKRGTLDMIVVDSEDQVLPVAATIPPQLAPPQSLGRFRVAGEICDGKCYPGGMRPGTGLAHKACASLCIIGGQPAVVALQTPVEGQSFLLLASSDGSLPPPVIYDLVALPVELEGEILRVGDLLILHADWTKAKRQ